MEIHLKVEGMSGDTSEDTSEDMSEDMSGAMPRAMSWVSSEDMSGNVESSFVLQTKYWVCEGIINLYL